MTVGDCFAGIGGFSLGFQRAGFEIRWQIENDPFCNRVLEKHWPDVKRYGDIREVDGRKLERVHLICGGDPCQENSNARQGTGLEQPSLGDQFIRIIDEVQPEFVLRENPSAVSSDAPWPWWRFRSALERSGFMVLPFRLRACCLGAEHQRDRLFVFGRRADTLQTRLQRHEFEEMAAATEQGLGHIAGCDRGNAAPRICRGADGIPDRVDRLKSLGNAVFPQAAQWIAEQIASSMNQPRNPRPL